MDKFNNTLLLLNNLIVKLQANTGGQSKQQVPSHQKTQQIPEVSCRKQKNTVEKLQVELLAKAEDKGQEKKGKKEKKQEKKVQKIEGKAKVQEGQSAKQTKKENKPEKKVEKKEQKQQKKQEGKSDDATVQDFAAIDIRIGEIVQCWKHPQSQKLYCEKINIGGQVRQIASGLQQNIPIAQMKGLVIVMANLKPRPLAKFLSNGMVVCASNADHTDIRLIVPNGQIGERAYLQGHQRLFKNVQVLPVLNPKKKILQRCLEHFKTDEEGFIRWKGIKLRTSGGYLRSQLKDGNVS